MARVHKKLSERIADKIEKEGDCVIWQGAMIGNSPVVSHRAEDGKYRNINIRAFRGMKMYEGTTVTTRFGTSCGNPRCIAKDHIVLGSFSKGPKTYRPQAKKNDMAFNKQIFALSVKTSAEQIASDTLVSASMVRKMLVQNKAMYPYYSLKIAEVVNIEDLKAGRITRNDALNVYGLSPFAYSFVMNGLSIPVNDPELYVATLDRCAVNDSHLIALDDSDDTATMLTAAMYGADQSRGSHKTTCKHEGCVNPEHIKGIHK